MSALTGRRVLVTRERPGQLGTMLEDRGAMAVHIPLISVEDPEDDTLLKAQLGDLEAFDWLVVTSTAGAERVGAAAARVPSVRLAAVGATTARTMSSRASRAVDLVPSVQKASALADELIRISGDEKNKFLVAQADIAAGTLVEALRAAGHHVEVCVAYRTTLRVPDRDVLESADAVTFASGSAVRSWVQAIGSETPAIVVTIGPSTADVAAELGLKVSGVADDHSLEGLVTELERQFSAQDKQYPER